MWQRPAKQQRKKMPKQPPATSRPKHLPCHQGEFVGQQQLLAAETFVARLAHVCAQDSSAPKAGAVLLSGLVAVVPAVSLCAARHQGVACSPKHVSAVACQYACSKLT